MDEDEVPERDDEPTRVWREAMALPLGTVAMVEGKRAVLVGQVAGPRRWQWMDGGWTAIPLGAVEVLGHVDGVGPLADAGREALGSLDAMCRDEDVHGSSIRAHEVRGAVADLRRLVSPPTEGP